MHFISLFAPANSRAGPQEISQIMAESKQPGPLKSFLSGGAGGICLVLVGHPLDTIKVRIQTMQVVPGQPPPYNGLVDCARKIIAREGVTGLYKGMAAPLAGVAPMYALCFLGYGYGKKIFCDDDAFEKLKLTQIGLAGAFSSFFTTPILGPGERLKCVLQIQAAPDYKGPKYSGYKDLVQSLYKEGGIRSILRGSGITCVRDGVASFFYFSTYGELFRAPIAPCSALRESHVMRPQNISRKAGLPPGRKGRALA
jgi:solute carrier family 25 (mitochondrial carnitine/acylcarnitine transporter), member 20/29